MPRWHVPVPGNARFVSVMFLTSTLSMESCGVHPPGATLRGGNKSWRCAAGVFYCSMLLLYVMMRRSTTAEPTSTRIHGTHACWCCQGITRREG